MNLSKTPLVSICIPLFNDEKYVYETLKNLCDQSYRNIEIIIVDDFSQDNSFDIVKNYPDSRIKLFKNIKKGGNSARNFAFKQAKGDLIKFMDSDDLLSNNLIESQVEKYLYYNNPNILIFSPVYKYYDDGLIEKNQRNIDKDYIPGIELTVGIWGGLGFNCPHCYLMSKSLVLKSGGWDEEILKNQDGEYFARVANIAEKAISVPNQVVFWRQTFKGVSVNINKENIHSHFRTLISISSSLLIYKNDDYMRSICGKYIGLFLYTNYFIAYPWIKELSILQEKFDFKVIYPKTKKFLVLRKLIGQHFALIKISKSYFK